MLTTRLLDDATLLEALAFLRRHRATSLFLLGNLADHGPRLTAHPNSANFKGLWEGDRLVAVFALARRGNLLVQSEAPRAHAEALMAACRDEGLPLKGVLGEWAIAEPLWQARPAGLTTTFQSREILYRRPLDAIPPAPPDVRRLVVDDFPAWRDHHADFLAESGLPLEGGPEEEQRARFASSVALARWWGHFTDGRLDSMAALNASADGVGQVGGVYTPPAARRKGLSRQTLEGLMADAAGPLGLEELVLFTGEGNTGAQALYEGLGFERIGHFGIFFGA